VVKCGHSLATSCKLNYSQLFATPAAAMTRGTKLCFGTFPISGPAGRSESLTRLPAQHSCTAAEQQRQQQHLQTTHWLIYLTRCLVPSVASFITFAPSDQRQPGHRCATWKFCSSQCWCACGWLPGCCIRQQGTLPYVNTVPRSNCSDSISEPWYSWLLLLRFTYCCHITVTDQSTCTSAPHRTRLGWGLTRRPYV
jgi:hypothetical protein